MIDVLIPTYHRPAALAVTLTSLSAQTAQAMRIVVSDQTEDVPAIEHDEVRAVARVLRARGHEVEWHRNLPRYGMAQQRQFLLERARAPRTLYLDDDLILEPDVVERMVRALDEHRCGFAGMAVIGLSYVDDVRPHEQPLELWEGSVEPEEVTPDSPAWGRHVLHNAANLYHVQRRLALTPAHQRVYRVAWVGGCVLYDTEALRSVGGFSFHRDLPRVHAGEDVLAQLRVMAKYGGCGVIPSGVYHQELPTTVPDREVDAPRVLR